ncbi:TIGR04255 family protein [uncultured Marinobacter sp.]|uniref:TIGR04255 family protein n=1 Tax=uncultured Marinobacter sp. TaxID=187379 RepID=UPI0030DB4F7D|tara:strand:+ start:30232 stop:31026 length:795 start_codon:yes stop_codon:yes gene_type:complete
MKDIGFDRPDANHSLAEATLVVAFGSELEGSRMDQLRTIADELSGDFSKRSPNQAVNLSVSQGKAESSTSFNGWTLENVDQDTGLVRWQLAIERSRVIINCLEYPRWDAFKEQVINWLSVIQQHLSLESWAVKEVGTLFTDRFYWSLKGEEYHFEKLFNPDSEYLSPSIKSKGPLWHLFQGWIETDSNREFLHNLNVSTQWDINRPHKTEVLHIVRCLKGEDGELDGLNMELISTALDKAHTDNKKMLNELLSAETIEFIGLNK